MTTRTAPRQSVRGEGDAEAHRPTDMLRHSPPIKPPSSGNSRHIVCTPPRSGASHHCCPAHTSGRTPHTARRTRVRWSLRAPSLGCRASHRRYTPLRSPGRAWHTGSSGLSCHRCCCTSCIRRRSGCTHPCNQDSSGCRRRVPAVVPVLICWIGLFGLPSFNSPLCMYRER